jgi:DNA-binding NarL/FixJ family response regulator
MSQPRLLLADDHLLVAQAIANYLSDDCELLGIVDDGQKLVNAARTLKPDIIVSDISMPVLGGIEAVKRLREEGCEAKIIFLTMYSEPGIASEALLAGVSGYLPKNSAGEELVTAIREVMNGHVYLSPSIAEGVVSAMVNRATKRGNPLTPRQGDILRLIAAGMNVKQIAAELELSPRTVETHKYEMMHSLGVKSVAELVRYAVRSGLVAC